MANAKLPTEIAKVLAVLAPQALLAVTVIFPLVAPAPAVTLTEVVPCPELIVQPDGTVQLYEVASVTGEILYTSPDNTGQTALEPVIGPGVAGITVLMVTGKVCALLVPQELVAVTVISPFWPLAPEVTVMALVPAPDVMVHPAGTVQL